MKVIGRDKIEKFARSHADVRGPLQAWLNEAKAAEWTAPHQIAQRYSSTSFIGKVDVIFDIKGNKYRLWTLVDYKNQIVIVKGVGTHSEYDKWRIP